MKKKTAFVLVIAVTVLFAGRSFGTVQKISKLSVADVASANSDENWISVGGISGNSGIVTLEIEFENEYCINVDFASGSNGAVLYYSLSDVVGFINAVSLNLPVNPGGQPLSYTAASIIDSTVILGDYTLMLSSRENSPVPMQKLITSSTNAVLSGNFGDVATDLTGDNMYFFAAVPEPATLLLLGLGGLMLRRKRKI